MTDNKRWVGDDLEPREERFAYKGVRYLLTEPSASAMSAWRNALLQGSEIGPDGKPVGIKIRAETDSLLVSRCLYSISGGIAETGEIERGPESTTPVSQEFVESLPHRLQSKMITAIREMGDMNALPDTLEDCDKAIKECEERLVELRKQRSLLNGEAPPHLGNGVPATTGSSA